MGNKNKFVLVFQINKLQIQWQITSQYLGKLQIVGKIISIIRELPIVEKHSMVKKIWILENVSMVEEIPIHENVSMVKEISIPWNVLMAKTIPILDFFQIIEEIFNFKSQKILPKIYLFSIGHIMMTLFWT